MTTRIRKPLIALIVAAGSVLAIPAMAQSAQHSAAQAQNQAAQAQQAAAQAGDAADTAANAAAQANGGGGQTWASVDTDGNGTISKAEAQVNAGLDKHERMGQLVVVKDHWAVENGFLTPTLKIKRNVIESTYGPQLQAWSARAETVLWQD